MTTCRTLALSALVLALAACAKPVAEPVSPEKARAAFLASCQRRLENRTSLSAAQIASFCPCFASAAAARHDLNRLNAEMESGSDDTFKSTLQAEFEQCKRRI